jgi:hypothetical protein
MDFELELVISMVIPRFLYWKGRGMCKSGL